VRLAATATQSLTYIPTAVGESQNAACGDRPPTITPHNVLHVASVKWRRVHRLARVYSCERTSEAPKLGAIRW